MLKAWMKSILMAGVMTSGFSLTQSLLKDTVTFNKCVTENTSVLLQRRDLVLLCLREHTTKLIAQSWKHVANISPLKMVLSF